MKGNFENCSPCPAEESLFSCSSDKELACVSWQLESLDAEVLQGGGCASVLLVFQDTGSDTQRDLDSG